MKKKTIKRVNGGIAIYYGISCILAAGAGLFGIGAWVYKILNSQTSFSWGTLIGLTIITAVMGAIGYAILRVGYEQIEE